MLTDIAVFSSYSSCCEEGRYCASPDDITGILLGNRGPLFLEAVQAYHDVYGGQEWEDEVRSPTLLDSKDLRIIRQARAAQQILYLGAVEWLNQRHTVRLGCGFSLGYAAIFVGAKAISPSNWLRHIHPANGRYADDNLKVWLEGKTFTTLLSCAAESRFTQYVRALIAGQFPNLLVKDNRFPYAVQIVGTESDLQKLRSLLFEEFPDAEKRSTGLIRTDSAHLHSDRYADIQAAFRAVSFAPPIFEIATHSASLPAVQAIADPGSNLFQSFQGQLSMGFVNRRLAETRLPVVLIGSQRASKFAFYGFGPSLFQQSYFFWEELLQGAGSHAIFPLVQESPTW